MRNANQILAELMEISRQIDSGEAAKNKVLTGSKAAQRKLYAEYTAATS